MLKLYAQADADATWKPGLLQDGQNSRHFAYLLHFSSSGISPFYHV